MLGNALIMALHVLRTPTGWGRADFDHMVTRYATGCRDELDGFGELAANTGSITTVRPLLDALGAPVRETTATPADELQAWRLRTTLSGVKGATWALELRRTPARAWPAKLLRAALLTEAEIRLAVPGAKPGATGLFAARVKRLGWGAKALPKALLILWRIKREQAPA